MNILIIIPLCSVLCAICFSGALSYLVLIISLALTVYSMRHEAKKVSKYSILFTICFVIMSLRMMCVSQVRLELNREYHISGTVEEILSEDGGFQSILLKAEQINGVSTSQSIIVHNDKYKLDENSRAEMLVSTKAISSSKNFGMSNYEQYLNGKGIYNICEVKNLVDVEMNVSMIEGLRLKQIRYIEDVIDENLSSDHSGFIKSLLLSSKLSSESQLVELYKDFGLAHILAVSGLHISIIAVFIMWILSKTRLKYVVKVAIVSTLILWYSYLLGFPASTIRALIMFLISQLAIINKRKYNVYNSLGLAMGIMLIINPKWLGEVGFQLSFIASLSIAVLRPRVQVLLRPLLGDRDFGVSTFIAVNLGLFPIQMLYFNQFNIWSLVANVVLIPIVSIMLIICITGIAFSVLHINIIVGLLFKGLSLILNCTNVFLELLKLLPFQNFSMTYANGYWIVVYYIFLLIWLYHKYLFSVSVYRIYTCLLFVLLFGNGINYDDSLYIEFLDVGQGDSALITKGDVNMLIDTGGNVFGDYNPGVEVTCNLLKSRGIVLDMVFITHFDLDHSNGVDCIIDSGIVENFGISYEDESSNIYNSIVDSGLETHLLGAGDSIDIGELRFEIVSPKSGYQESNDNSLVLSLKYREREVLFTGDISSTVEDDLTDKLNAVDILKVAHHGSDTSSSERFLQLTSPEYAVISVGVNSYGHPSEQVLERLNHIGAKVFRTDEDGAIRFRIDDDIIYESFNGEAKIDFDLIIYIFFSILFNDVLLVLMKRKGRMDDESLRLLQ